MAIYEQTRLGELYRLIERDNPGIPPLTDTSVVVSAPVVNATDGKDTAVTITGIKYAGWRGKINVKYNRIDLATLTKNFVPEVTVPASAEKTLYAALPYLNATLGIYLEETDFADGPLVLDPETFLFKGTITLSAACPVYKGKVDFVVSGFGVSLETLLTVRDLDCLKDNSVHVPGRICQTMLQYGVDYSALSPYLKTFLSPGSALTLSDNGAKELAKELTKVDGLPWVWATAAREFNLRGAQFYYNGPPKAEYAGSKLNPTPDFAYERVLIFQANATYCTNLATGANGWWMFVHYDLVEE